MATQSENTNQGKKTEPGMYTYIIAVSRVVNKMIARGWY
jgi:hypothetical protein